VPEFKAQLVHCVTYTVTGEADDIAEFVERVVDDGPTDPGAVEESSDWEVWGVEEVST